MASRKNEKARRRAERVAAEQRLAAADRRTRMIRRLAAALMCAAAAAAALIVIAQHGAATGPASSAEIEQRAAGLAQRDGVVGDLDAPVRIVEFGDLQCPACRQFSQNALDEVLDRTVRAGKATFQFRHWAFLGEDSRTAAGAAMAADRQSRGLQFIEAFYAAQGAENSGYVTDQFLDEVARSAGLDIARFNADRRRVDVDAEIAAAAEQAAELGLSGTPSFVISGPGGEVTLNGAASPADFEAAVDRVTK